MGKVAHPFFSYDKATCHRPTCPSHSSVLLGMCETSRDILWCLSLNTAPNLSLLKGRTNSEDIHGDLHCKPFSQGLSNLAVPKGQYGISKDVPWCRGVASYFKAVWSCKVYIPHVVSRGVWGNTIGKFC